MRDIFRSASVSWGLPVSNFCRFWLFLFSSPADFIHTVYSAVHDRIRSLVPSGKKSSLILVSSPHILQMCLKKINCLFWPHRHCRIARSAEFSDGEDGHFCWHCEKKGQSSEASRTRAARKKKVQYWSVGQYADFINHSQLSEDYLNLLDSVNSNRLIKVMAGWLCQTP